MTKIKEYLAKGEKRYKFVFYAGIDNLTGKKKYIRKQGFTTKREARIALSRLELQKENGELAGMASNSPLFSDVATEYMEAKRLSLRTSTYFVQTNMLKHIVASLGKLKIKDIRGYHCQNAVNRWADRLPGSVSSVKILANQIFEYAIRNGYIRDNPMDGVILPKKAEKKREDNYYTKQELSMFLTFIQKNKPLYYPLFRLLAYSGMRIGELLALTWDDIDLKNGTVSINKTLSRSKLEGDTIITKPKTKTGVRMILIDDVTTQALASHKQEQNKRLFALGILNTLPKPLFVFDRGMGASYNQAQGQRYKRTSDIRGVLNRIYTLMPKDFKRITLHGFRHTHATLLIEAGASVKAVQQRLGHSNVTMTLGIYAHATKKMDIDAVNRLSMYMDI